MTFDVAAFARDGYVRLSASIDVDGLRQRVGAFLAAQRGIVLAEPATWPVGRVGAFQEMTSLPFVPSTAITAACDAVLGDGTWRCPDVWGAPLVTFPEPGPWRFPDRAWHVDFAPRFVAGGLPGARLLAFLDAVRPRGGGTVLLAGSHRLVELLVRSHAGQPLHSADVRRLLRRRWPVLRALERTDAAPEQVDALTNGVTIEDAPLILAEAAGSPGDVLVMHPWLLHAASANCSDAPRLMLSQSIFRHTRNVMPVRRRQSASNGEKKQG